ncbi:MAG: MYG1 family protein [Succinivibrio sp.]|nr:MYG1 family protein [Succinivibrio sp.]
MLIATHDGTFHADETMACAIITYLYDRSKIIRSRNSELLETADLIIDVSSLNDEKHYDHHSKDFNRKRSNGIRYATAGLMWEKYGMAFMRKVAEQELSSTLKPELLEHACARIDREIMCMIDINDNGDLTSFTTMLGNPQTASEEQLLHVINEFYQNDPNISYIVAMMNSTVQSEEEQNKQFTLTVKMLKTILEHSAINALQTEIGIEKVLKAYKGGQMLILHERLPWTSAVFANMETFKDCLIAIYPDRNQRWRIQSLPVSQAQRFSNRLSAPVELRGLNDEALNQATGLENLNFIHRSGFTGGASTYEDCLKLARLWIERGIKA